MTAELGQWCLALAFTLALAQSILSLAGAARDNRVWIAAGRGAAQAQTMLLAVAFALLAAVLLANDFSVDYVARHSNSALPAIYRFAAAWGGHEGSLLLWTLMLAAWTVLAARGASKLDVPFAARVTGVLGIVSAGFAGFMLFTSNPFTRLLPAAFEGNDLNPLLQDPGLVIHPPMLYAGYVGFAVPFAFAAAALLSGRIETQWARWCRPWTIAAWVFLTIGIALGSIWAYYELGWGGWWFWDPVENASFMPWLAGTALMHSLAVTEKRGAFLGWTLLLSIVTFGLSLLGTFLVRSGVLTSVHAFAVDPARGVFILGLIALIIGGALVLFAWRMGRMRGSSSFTLLSRESLLMLNNVFLTVAMLSVMIGTLYPLALDAFGVGKISVGPPYFEAVFVPLMAPMIFLMGIGPLARWKRTALPDLRARLRWALAAALVCGALLPWLTGTWTYGTALGLTLAGWIAAALVAAVAERVSQASRYRLSHILKSQPLAFYGMLAAHGGIAFFIVGVTLVGEHATERTVRLAQGEQTAFAGYDFHFTQEEERDGPNYAAMRVTLEVTRNGHAVTRLQPEKRFYPSQRNVMTEAAIDPGLTRDLYVSLGEALPDGAWIVRLYHKPFIGWIWGGTLLMALGGLLALADRRYRARRVAPESATGGALADPSVESLAGTPAEPLVQAMRAIHPAIRSGGMA